MSNMTYCQCLSILDKAVVWLHGEVKTPPFTSAARIETGYLLRKLQLGEKLSMPQSRPMATIGKRCYELRISDRNVIWRIIYRTDIDAIIILSVFDKKTNKTPKNIIDLCKIRLRDYDDEAS